MEHINFLNLDYLFLLIYNLFSGGQVAGISLDLLLWERFKVISIFISLFLLVGVVYCIIRILQIRAEVRAKLGITSVLQTSEEKKNERWEKVKTHLSSENPNDWRQAIIEADVLLDEMVQVMGYTGENLGERLKKIERSDFDTLDQAWEAHKIRNAIAHEGSNFVLTAREARRIIALYRQVFEEFEFI